mmetsp:Transcript_33134/g.40734  ORF Transcript_33134/g.40734 Transcript_33134/m.40734 type:complete len:97 (+) Transcript_33134:274-564(+)
MPQFTKPTGHEPRFTGVTGEVPPIPWHHRQVEGSTHWHPPQSTFPGSQLPRTRLEMLPVPVAPLAPRIPVNSAELKEQSARNNGNAGYISGDAPVA